MKQANSDPTRSQMRRYLIGIWPDVAGYRFSRTDHSDQFDLERAIYWFAVHYHGGQWSNLYSVSSSSQYRPGRLENGIAHIDGVSFGLYCALIRKYINCALIRKYIKGRS